MAYTFEYINHTGLSKAEIMRRAKDLRDRAPFHMTMQQAIDCVIDAAAEYAQG